MLDQLSGRIQKVIKFLKGEGKITEKNMAEAMKMLRLAFLEADVNYKVVKGFEAEVKEKALDEKVLLSLTPAQQVIKIIRDELTRVLGEEKKGLCYQTRPPSVFMLVGLQGVGKTTTAGKLAWYVGNSGKNPLLVSVDIKRPAAQAQLKTIGEQLKIPVYELPEEGINRPEKILQEVLFYSRKKGFDPLIMDTAGRLHVDEELMEELRLIRNCTRPSEIIYVGDSMTGQDAVNSARRFEEILGITSIILTKLDGDARGGAALSIVKVTGKPIKFIGVGEKYDKLEPFHPDRMASRILGMGDILSLIEKAEAEADQEEADELARKLRNQELTLEDFKKQLSQVKKMGSLSNILSHMPTGGMFRQLSKISLDEKKLIHFEAIINSMTLKERNNPKIINGSRRARIARGSGQPVSEVNQLLKQFFEMKKMMKKSQFQKMLQGFPLSH